LIYWLNIFESLEVLKWEKRPPEETNVRSGERLKRSPAKAG